ncbi:MAG: hypothetical protein GAK43_01615 [Stenotrophomonas maltophilia]|nr:MAG: hypothetical protein GAK43_01615 [Stenotrophomonas maltophilia]
MTSAAPTALPRSTPHALLWREVAAVPAYGTALLLALALVTYLYPWSFLAGHGLFFEGGDAASHVAGWLFYARDSWHFPLLKTTRLGYPDGTSIAFTDSLPLMALLLKPFAGLLPEGFHYFGLWHAFCYLLQALGAVFLIRSLGVRHLPGALLAAAFALIFPALTHRLGHTALMTHGLLLLALGCYLRGRYGHWSPRRCALSLIALSACALLVHPYLMAMSYPLLLVSLVSQWRLQRITLRQAAGWLALSLAVLLVILVAGGYLIGKSAAAGGFGIYSLNLLSPLCGGQLCQFNYASAGQDEGFNYLGGGTLLLLALALLLGPREALASLSRHRYLLLALLGMTLFALSNRIFAGSTLLLDIPLPHLLQGLAGIFRVSGRFFWLVGYCLLFFALATLLRRRSLLVLLTMIAALGLQWYDTQGLRDRVRWQTALPSTLDLAPWRQALAGYDSIDVYPAYGCGTNPTDDYVRYQYLAAKLGLRINTAYTARPTTDCVKAQRFADGPAQPGHLYVRAGYDRDALDLPALFHDALAAKHCGIDQVHLLCTDDWDAARWQPVATPLTTPISSAQWQADRLPSIIGLLRDGWLVPRVAGTPGYLSYGPYIRLSAGPYRYQIHYRSQAPAQTEVGTWDLTGQDPQDRQVIIASGPLHGSQGADAQVQGSTTLNGPLRNVELRTLSNGADLQVHDIGLQALGTQDAAQSPPAGASQP